MKLKSTIMMVVILLAAGVVLLAACSGSDQPVEPSPAATTKATSGTSETIDVISTYVPGDGTGSGSGEDVYEIMASRTPAPTVMPGAIEDAVEGFIETVGIEGLNFLGLSSADWVNIAISIILALFLYRVGMWLIQSLLRRVVERTATDLDDRFLTAMNDQIRWFITIFAIEIALLRLQFIDVVFKTRIRDISFLLYLVTSFFVTWKLVGFALDHLQTRLSQRMDSNQVKTLMQLVGWVVKFFVVFIYITIMLEFFGISITAVTAVLGLGGLALSLAAQDTIADFISGIIILIDQPFRVGDRIEIDKVSTWGDVVEIGMRSTKILTRDNRLVIIPNSTIGSSAVVNYTFPDSTYRVQIELGIGYGQDIEEIRRIISEAVEKVDGVLKEHPVDALFLEFGETTMTFRVRWWIDSYVDTRRMFDKVNQVLYTALEGAGIEMPFTTYDVNIKMGKEKVNRISEAFDEDGASKP
ncbi:MAG: mechanosensitive ion channel [Anaerolineales bacterium]|nr:mechanosensitive ion channel [Anaerolineales bacterium]